MSTVKANLNSTQRDEIESFLRAAQTADEDDLYIVESPELETALLIEITDGSSIRDVWADHLRDFLE